MKQPTDKARLAASKVLTEQHVWAPISMDAAPRVKPAVQACCADIAAALDDYRHDALEEVAIYFERTAQSCQ